MVVSVGIAVVSATTAVVSPSSGAAPTSSSARPAQAASDAAAASIKRYFIGVLLWAEDPARLRVSAAVVRVPRAKHSEGSAALFPAASRECTPTFSIPIGHTSQGKWGGGKRESLSSLEFGTIAELVQGCGVGQGVHLGHRPAVDHVPHRKFGDFAADGAGNVCHLDDLPGHVVGAGIVADPTLDAPNQVLREGHTVSQPHE